MLRIGADIGGTFTDVVVMDDRGEVFGVAKVLTTPDWPDDAVMEGAAAGLASVARGHADVTEFIHGTTLFTNALIERRGARTALITTRGFRDVIEIGREHRFDMYDLYMKRSEPLAPRPLRFEVDERVLSDGQILEPLDEASLTQVISEIRASNVEAVAICFINSYVNDSHERRAGERLKAALPGVAVTLSSDLVPEVREVERTSTALANVYVLGIAERYLMRLQKRIAESGMPGRLLIMQSNGGVCETDLGCRYPIRLVESGPAGGAIAAARFGHLLGRPNLLSFDMGGTTAKACVILGGEPLLASDFEVDRQYRFTKGSGLPVRVPVIEMVEIGTGGGSIAAVDDLGRMSVGPRSAGSRPGPACYGLGGTRPTVTDSDLVLGYLDPEFFLGGTITLDLEAARRAIDIYVGGPLGLGTIEAAAGIHSIANESMASAARIHSIERGCNLERFAVFAFGGAGPVHAYGVARTLRSPEIVYPPNAGVLSALGFLAAPISFDRVRSAPADIENIDWATAEKLLLDMEADTACEIAPSVPTVDIGFRRFADMRYRGQGFEVRVALPAGPLEAAGKEQIKDAFEAVYKRLYGHLVPGGAIEFVSWRVIASGPAPNMHLPKVATQGAVHSALKKHRRIYLPHLSDYKDVPVYDRYRLMAGAIFEGPAIVEENESTAVIAGPGIASVDATGCLIVKMPGNS